MASIIVAVSLNGVIGKGNDLPWRLPADLKKFKEITMGHHIIMGRKCYESIGRPLPGRTNVIITRNPEFYAPGCVVSSSLNGALKLAEDSGDSEPFIIGGGEIYKQGLKHTNKIYLTRVMASIDGDVYFPEINLTDWELVNEQPFISDEKNPFDYKFSTYLRKTTQ